MVTIVDDVDDSIVDECLDVGPATTSCGRATEGSDDVATCDDCTGCCVTSTPCCCTSTGTVVASAIAFPRGVLGREGVGRPLYGARETYSGAGAILVAATIGTVPVVMFSAVGDECGTVRGLSTDVCVFGRCPLRVDIAAI